MKGHVALVREQGQNLAILLVQDHVITDARIRDQMLAFAAREFAGRPALIGERNRQTYGPPDIVRWLQNIAPEQLPWREFTLNN